MANPGEPRTGVGLRANNVKKTWTKKAHISGKHRSGKTATPPYEARSRTDPKIDRESFHWHLLSQFFVKKVIILHGNEQIRSVLVKF